MENLKSLIATVAKLRDPNGGCPWDLKQNHQSLLPYLVEETYELIAEIENAHDPGLKEELGDVLLQIVLHAQLASERSAFTIDEVAADINKKLIRRHPHVFGDKQGLTPEQVKEQWQEIKKQEKPQKADSSIPDKVLYAPALNSADLIGHKTAELNFDWDDPLQVAYKVEEEWQELKDEINARQSTHNYQGVMERVEEEFGDLLFTVAQLGRHLGLDSEQALRKANHKFMRRFRRMEELMKNDNKEIKSLNSNETEDYWSQVKEQEKGN